METTNTNINKGLGLLIMICAIGITILNIFLAKDVDAYIMPFILLVLGISLLQRKQSGDHRELFISPKRQKAVLVTLSISLVAGIITMLVFI